MAKQIIFFAILTFARIEKEATSQENRRNKKADGLYVLEKIVFS